MRVGILPLGRPTFDVPFAEEKLSAILTMLDDSGHEIVGPRSLLFDAEATSTALDQLQSEQIEHLLLLQVTFTDASMTIVAANRFEVPLSIWAVKEPRAGERLRLNSFCGLNLASHALGLNKRTFGWLYADPVDENKSELHDLLAGKRLAGQLSATPLDSPSNSANDIVENLQGKRIARLGEHPVGFDTCAYNKAELKSLAGIEVDELDLNTLFQEAKETSSTELVAVREIAESTLSGLDDVDKEELDRSLRLKVALDRIQADKNYSAFAIRCWPETFTEYGGAVCGPVSMLGEARIPCACEADVYGAVTQLVLQEVAQAPVFLADLVDMDTSDDTGVVWHCGQAPISMCDAATQATATIHTNRKMPLLYEFPLREGRITLMRISQSFGEPKMILSGGSVLKRPMAFTGTSGVVKFDRPASNVLEDVMSSGLEHHMALAYGDHRELLRSVASSMNLPVLEI